MISSFIAFIIKVYMFVIIVDAVLSFFPQFRHYQWYRYLREAAELSERPIRKYLPRDIPMDISPIIVIVLLNIFLLFW